MRELERHLGVSYPTARARVDDLLRALGLAPIESDTGAADSSAPDSDADPRLATLRAVAAGELDVDKARGLLGS